MKKSPLIYHEKILHDLRDIVYFKRPAGRRPTEVTLFVLLRRLHDLLWAALYSKGYYFDYVEYKWDHDIFHYSK